MPSGTQRGIDAVVLPGGRRTAAFLAVAGVVSPAGVLIETFGRAMADRPGQVEIDPNVGVGTLKHTVCELEDRKITDALTRNGSHLVMALHRVCRILDASVKCIFNVSLV